MKKSEKQKIVGKLKAVEQTVQGEPLYFRPFAEDDRFIGEISRATGEKKSAVAQKLLRLALAGKQIELAKEPGAAQKLDWLINNEKHKAARLNVLEAKFDRLEEHARELEKTLQTVASDARFSRILGSEIYCGTSVCVSYLNQIFTKIIEYFSPVEIERKMSVDFANRNIAGLIEHSLVELENLSEHHALDLEAEEMPETLYIYTKIERIKAKLQAVLNA